MFTMKLERPGRALSVSRAISRRLHAETHHAETILAIIVRAPRNSEGVTFVARMRLRDRACVCLLFTTKENDVQYFRDKCLKLITLIETYPFHPMLFILEERLRRYSSWLQLLWDRVARVEEETGMTAWAHQGRSSNKDYSATLQKLHALNVELLLAETTMKFSTELVRFCHDTLTLVQESGREIGSEMLELGKQKMIEQDIGCNKKVHQFMDDKLHELLSRVRSQINVVSKEIVFLLGYWLRSFPQTFSLVAQQDSKASTSIAESAARDGQTMKTITVITLLFLPSTLLAVYSPFHRGWCGLLSRSSRQFGVVISLFSTLSGAGKSFWARRLD